MPQLPLSDDDRLHGGDYAGAATNRRVLTFWQGFANFAFRDNILEIAVGLIFAASFTAAANSLVTDIILPFISLLPFFNRNLTECFVVLRKGASYREGLIERYNTVEQGLDDGAIIWAYGNFFDKTFRFFVIAVSLYLIARIYEWVSKDRVIKPKVKCKYCRKYISEKAKRCINCTSWQDGREDR